MHCFSSEQKNKESTQVAAQAPILAEVADPKVAGAVPPAEMPVVPASALSPVAKATAPTPQVPPPAVAASRPPGYAEKTVDGAPEIPQTALNNTSSVQPTAAPKISRLNSPCSSTGSAADLAGRKYTSALNSRTSALNTASFGTQPEGAGDESRDDSVASRGQSSSDEESTGGSGTESESGSGSSSDEEEEEEEEEEEAKEGAWRPQHGGKTVPGKKSKVIIAGFIRLLAR